MNKNMDENKAEPKILLERYSRCKIPVGKICESLFKSKNIDIETIRAVYKSKQEMDIKAVERIYKSVLESKKNELENLKKSYKLLMESQKNDIEQIKLIYQSAIENKELDIKKWQENYNTVVEAEKPGDIGKYEVLENVGKGMLVRAFIKSPEFGDNKWHWDFTGSYDLYLLGGCNDTIMYISYHDRSKNKKLCRTSEMMFLVNNENLSNINETMDLEEQIKMLKDAGFKEFTVQFDEQIKWLDGRIRGNKLKIVDENGKIVDYMQEEYQKLGDNFYYTLSKHNLDNCYCEYINLAHNDSIAPIGNDMKDKLHSVIILSKNAKMSGGHGWSRNGVVYYCSSFHRAKNSLTFYCEPGSKVAIDILSKCQYEEKYPEFYNATIVFMSHRLVVAYQENLDNVVTYKTMKEFIKSYKENEDYFSFTMSDCRNYNQQRMDQLLQAQTKFSGTWENFVGFIKKIVFNEKSDVKTIEDKNENNENGENIATQNSNVIGLNQNTIDITKNSHFGEINNKNNKKDIEPVNDDENKKDRIGKADKKNKIESKLKNENQKPTQNSGVGNSNKQTGNTVYGLPLVESDNKNNKKNVELIKENEKEDIKINEVGNKSENEPKPELKDENKTLTRDSSLAGNIEKEMAQNIEIKTSENKDNKIDNPEDHLNVFMQYLKNHLPTIFKFINAIRRFFSRFISRSKNKSKNDVKNSFRDTVDAIDPKPSVIDKASDLSSQENVRNNPNNMESQPVDSVLQ